MRGAVVFLFLCLVCAFAAQAQELPERNGYVNDLAHVLSEATKTQLEATLTEYAQERDRSTYVLLVPTLEGMSVNAYDEAIAEAWGLQDQDVLMLISLEESAIHLSAGEKIKTLYTDAFLDSVMKSMIPALAQGNFDGAVVQGVDRLVSLKAIPAKPANLLDGPFRFVLLAGVVALSLLLYALFLA